MLRSAPRGSLVLVWYAKPRRELMPHHDTLGTLLACARGKGPRNHAVQIGTSWYTIPAGNLRLPSRADLERHGQPKAPELEPFA